MRTCRRARLTRSCMLAVISAACIIVYLLSLSNGGANYKRSQGNLNRISDEEYKQMAKPALERPSDLDPKGLGEGGTAVRLPDLKLEDKQLMDKSIEVYAVNQYISERISLHRRLKDTRHEL